MAIDLLSRDSQTPIVVGDKAEMKVYQRCAVETIGDKNWIVMSDDAEAAEGSSDELRCNISLKTARSLAMSEHVLLVGINEANELTHAIKTPINDLVSPFRYLDEAEVKDLAETLVASDFNLDYLR